MIGADVDLATRIGELTAVRRQLGADAGAEPEAPARIEQAVAAVIAEADGRGGDEEGTPLFDASLVERPLLVGRERLDPAGVCPCLVPDEVALTLDVARDLDGLRFIGVVVGVARQRLQVENLVAPPEVASAELDSEQVAAVLLALRVSKAGLLALEYRNKAREFRSEGPR